MIEGLVWLAASVAAVGALAWIVPRAVHASITLYRQRNREPASTAPPSMVCPQCAGAWGNWSQVGVTKRPNNLEYPTLYGSYDQQVQTRCCTECGFAERRVL